ncbi:FAD-dependent oxidoreductase [Nocardia asiatica]|uniref:FAD-dependent oxidoreductase n=1 Tax=Nocardia asiatica TaxID=209252 RepID=UPI003EE0F43B
MVMVGSPQDVDVPIAVIGAGIGGLAAALALHRKGLSCSVFEQASVSSEVGAGLQVAPNAGHVLHALGLAEPLAEVAVRSAALHSRRWSDDTPLTSLRVSSPNAPYYTLHRADLHRVLAEALPAEALRLNHRCTAVRASGRRVTVEFAGSATLTAGLVIGQHRTVPSAGRLRPASPGRAAGRWNTRRVRLDPSPRCHRDQLMDPIASRRSADRASGRGAAPLRATGTGTVR